jgi:two-component system sensor histidine kinase VicK
VVSVADRGEGVPEKDRGRVFERFFQVGDPAQHSSEGIGLGLYIAREIVEAHGGEIWCEPREGGGSIFRFTIPACRGTDLPTR